MLHTINMFILAIISQFGLWILAGILFVVILKWLSVNKKDITLVQGALLAANAMLGDKLGAKGQAVIKVWLDALNEVSSKPELDFDDALDAFVGFVKISMMSKNIVLTPEELQSVRDVAHITMQSTNVKAQSTNRAVKAMMMERYDNFD